MKESNYIIDPAHENYREWFELAGHDLDSAVILLDENGYPDIIVYHCHQFLEKLIKSILIKQYTSFEKTHKLDMLMQQVDENVLSKFNDDILYVDGYRTKTR